MRLHKLGLLTIVLILCISFAYGARMYCKIDAPSGAEVCSEYVTLNLSSTNLDSECNCFVSNCYEVGAYTGLSYSNDLTYWNQGANTSDAFHSTTHNHLVSTNPDTAVIGYGIAQRGSTDAAGIDDPTDIACCTASKNCSIDGVCYKDDKARGTIPNRYYCNNSFWYGGDTNRDVCFNVTGVRGIWNIGGEVSGTKCCGDDSSEYNLTRKCISGCTSDLTDNACCNLATDCVYASACYSETSYMAAPWNASLPVSCIGNKWGPVNCAATNTTDTDGGDVPSIAGIVTDYEAGSGPCPNTTYTDYCTGNTLTEYYPNGVSYSLRTYTCADMEVAAVDSDGDNSGTTGDCTPGTGASCASGAFNLNLNLIGVSRDYCGGVICGTGKDSCYFVEYIANDSVADSCPGKDTCIPKQYDADTNSNTCYTCRGNGYWDLKGEAAPSACCGDDSSEYRVSQVGGTDAPLIYRMSSTALCCDTSTDCNFEDKCFKDRVNSSKDIPDSAACISGIWYGGDYSEESCTMIVGDGRWALGHGDVALADCCGDDNGEFFKERTGPAYQACCDVADDWLDTSGNCQPYTSLGPNTYIHGYVQDNKGGAIKDATVKVITGSTNNLGDSNFTDGTGYYRLFVDPGTFYLMAYAPIGFTANFSERSILNAAEPLSINFTLWPTSLSCEDDCTYNEDTICHSACHGTNGCSFSDDIVRKRCDNRGVGFTVFYDEDRDVVCCEGAPFIRTNARILSYDTTNKIRQVRVVMLGGKLVQMIVDVFR